MLIYQVIIEQLDMVSMIVEVEAAAADAAADLAIEVAPAQDWEAGSRGSECTPGMRCWKSRTWREQNRGPSQAGPCRREAVPQEPPHRSPHDDVRG